MSIGDFPGNCESTNLDSHNLGREIGRMSVSTPAGPPL